jgi:hypothetical protein
MPAGATRTDMTAHHVVPPVPGTAARPPVPDSDVEAWRLRRLVDAGFPLPLALELAATPGVDLHALLALLDRGCPPELAARILAPIDVTFGRP